MLTLGLAAHWLPAHGTIPNPSIAILLAHLERLHKAFMTVHVAAVRRGGIGVGLHTDDAGALADAKRFICGGRSVLLGGDGGDLLGLEEFFFGGGGFVCEVELFDRLRGGVV